MTTSTVPLAAAADKADAPVTAIAETKPVGATGGAAAVVDVVGEVVTSPPETAVTWAVPEWLSETRLTRATPSLVFPCSSMRPRVVKNWTTVPSATGVPVASITKAVITETSPWAAIAGGFAVTVRLEPGGAVMIAWLQVPRNSRSDDTRNSRAVLLRVMRHLPSNERSRRHRHAHRRRDAELLRARHGDDRQRVRRYRPRSLAQGAERDGGDHAGAGRPGGSRALGPGAARLQAALDADRRAVEGQERAGR